MTSSAAPAGPTISRRRLRAALRQLREDNGFTLDAVRAAMEWSTSKLTRIESGLVSISTNDLRMLLRHYAVPDTDAEPYLALVQVARQQHWASAHREHAPAAYMEFIGCDTDARQTSQYHPYLVPELLQTEAYAAAVIAARPGQEEHVDALARLRMRRQERLLAAQGDGRAVRIFLDQRAIPSGRSEVMRQQVEHIDKMIDFLDVGVLPLDVPATAALVGGFTLAEFTHDSALVHLDDSPALPLVDDPTTVDRYQLLLEQLDVLAVRGDKARRLLPTLAAR